MPTEGWLLLANLLVFLSVYAGDPRHSIATANSLQMITADAALLGLFAIGITVVIISGGIDLSVGSLLALAAVMLVEALRAIALPEGPAGGQGCRLGTATAVPR